MIQGERTLLRPFRDEDWPVVEEWGQNRNALWGPFQRFQLDHLPALREAYQQTGLLTRQSGFLLIETIKEQQVVGFVRYTLLAFPDADLPYPEIGCGIGDRAARRQGYAGEAIKLLIGYLFNGYPTERLAAFTDTENEPAKHMLEKLGFQQEGILRRTMFRDGRWCSIAAYSLLRDEWNPARL